MHTFAGIVSEALSERDADALRAMLPPHSGCGTYPHAAFGASPRTDGTIPLRASENGGTRTLAIFSGRLENASELRSMLKKSGFAISDDSPPEELLSCLYAKYGSDAFPRLQGAFAAALYDPAKRRLLLARDVIGAEPLYYFVRRDVLAFSNRLSALEKHPLMPKDPDVNAIGTFLSLQYIPEPDTVYRNVRKLPPGHLLEIRLETANPSIRRFDKLDLSVKREELGFSAACAELRRDLTSAVAKEMENRNGGIGVFLSGGLDSTILAALAAKNSGGRPVDVFTVGFSDAAYDERELAAESARFINSRTGGALRHHLRELPLVPLELAEKLAAGHGEPYADASVMPTYLLYRFASETTGAAFGGDGGDELFAGYERYSAMRIAGFFDLLPERLRKTLFPALAKLVPDSGERTMCGRLRRMMRLIGDSSHDAYFHLLDRCPAECGRKLFGPKLRDALWRDPAEIFSRLEWELTAANPTESFSELDIRTYLPGDGCAKLDIAAGAAGFEVVTPYLTRKIVDFSTRLPFEYKMLGSCRKRIMKAAFADLLPPDMAKRRKRGFGTPIAGWLRTHWRSDAEALLFDSALCADGYIERDALRGIWEEHQSGKLDRSYLLWSLVNLAWFLDRRRL